MEGGTPISTPESLAVVVGSLVEAADVAWSVVDDAELLGALAVLPEIRNRVDALAGRVARAAKTSGACGRAGFRQPDLFIGAQTNSNPAQSRRDLAYAKWLLDYPLLRDAFETGAASVEHVRLIKKVADDTNKSWVTTALGDPVHQQSLVDSAIKCTFGDFKVALQCWLNSIDPDGELVDEQVAKAGLSIRRGIDGSVELTGELDPIRGTELYTAIEAEKAKLLAHDEATGQRRSQPQLNLDALMNLARRGATRADGSLPQPLINVVMGHDLATALVEALTDPDLQLDFTSAFDTSAWDRTGADLDRRCMFLDGTPLHPKLALTLFGAQTLFRRVIFKPDERPEVSIDARFFAGWQKQVKLIETLGTCEEPGCDALTHWLHGDHHQPHSKGGPTTYENLRMFCPPANGAKSDTWNPDNQSGTDPP